MPGVWLATKYAAQNQTESGVCVRSITVPAVRRVSRRHFRQQKNSGASGVSIGFATRFAVGADEPMAPSRTLKVCRTRSLVRKQTLEFRKRTRKRQIVSPKHVDGHDFLMLAQGLNLLPVACVCDNRISTERSFAWQGCVGNGRRDWQGGRQLALRHLKARMW